MTILKSSSAPRFDLPGLHVTGLASPARGSRETSVWRLTLAAATAGARHSVDREELFVALAGRAVVELGDETLELAAGDTLVVPPNVQFALSNPHAEPFEAIAALPVGGRARMPGGEPFVPPWAA
jgi:mannose-6-phosphate isomerase-like protein (cupin superfamily)